MWVLPYAPFPYEGAHTEGVDVYSGADAYAFLLRVACGLESEVKGETDIFGQLKEAWHRYELNGTHAQELSPWFRRLFEDTKEIRASHLQNVGGASYGSLVRKLLKQYDPDGPVLLVGAGKIAQSIAPWLLDSELWVTNRTETSLNALVADLESRPGFKVIKPVIGEEAERAAWQSAQHVVICIPIDEQLDPRRLAWFKEGSLPGVPQGKRAVFHLGGMREHCGLWNQLEHFHPLDDLFAIEKVQDRARSVQFARAIKACEDKARLRSLSGSPAASATLPHGWEDLALFA